MPFAWFVALRYLRAAKDQTALILAAVSVGVAVVVFLSALINGLQVSLIDKTLGSQAHVTLRVPREAPRLLVAATQARRLASVVLPAPQRVRSTEHWPAMMTDIEHTFGVSAVSPMFVGFGFTVRSDAKEPFVIRGVDPERMLAIIDIRKKLAKGRCDLAGGEVAIGSSLARTLDVGVGDKIRPITTERVEDIVTISGIFTLGNEVVDITWLIAALRHAQSLYALPSGVTTLELKVADVFDAERVASTLHERLNLDANSWMSLNAQLFTGLSAQSNSKVLNMIGLLDRPTSGRIVLAGKDTSGLDERGLTKLRAHSLGFIFQFHHLLPAFTTIENVMLPAWGYEGFPSRTMRAQAEELLRAAGLADRMCFKISDLSGGQQQCVAIARALSHRRPLVLADEPTGNLDTESANGVFELMQQFNRDNGTTFLVVTHDSRIADRCESVIDLVEGHVRTDVRKAGMPDALPQP